MPDFAASQRRLLLAIAFAAAFLATGWPVPDSSAQESAPKSVVTLVIDYGDGVQKRLTLPWSKEMTVADALKAAAAHPRGIKYKSRGKGETLFVTAIDDCDNEGSGRNWTYTINDKPATKSCGVAAIEAGDVVLWKFASRR
jgi:hypothetical protein